MGSRPESGGSRHDEAARAGWLYYVAGNTQDQIAAKLGVSRQTAQRLVSLAVSEGLIKVRLDHPIANCLDLAEQLALALCARPGRGRAERSRHSLDDDRRRRGGRRRDRAVAALGRSDRAWRSAPAAR